jgi:hypothetical protein
MFSHIQRFSVLTLMILSTFFLSLRQSEAGLISTSQAFESVSLEQKRARVIGFLERSDVEEQFVKLGVSAAEARARVQHLTDADVLRINERLDQLPAGQDGIGAVLGFVLILFIILLITDILHLTKVFPFTR